jgi:F-type H+-transporting ATPase subunit gamma
MKMVAAAKLRRAQDKIVQMRPYAMKMSEMLGNLGDNLSGSAAQKYFSAEESAKTLFVLVTSDRGLCGAFNSSLFKELRHRFEHGLKGEVAAGHIDLYCIGKKGRELMQRYGANVIAKHDGFFQAFSYGDCEKIANELMGLYSSGEYSKIYLVYNQFKNAATYLGQVEQWLPLVSTGMEGVQTVQADYIFEPGKAEILDELVPKSLRMSVYKAVLDSNASEHGARMTAMDSATENAQEMLRNLSIEYNKARQAAITTEILEIVGGAEALANG